MGLNPACDNMWDVLGEWYDLLADERDVKPDSDLLCLQEIPLKYFCPVCCCQVLIGLVVSKFGI